MLYTYCLIPEPQSSLSLPQGLAGELNLVKQKQIAAVVEAELPLAELEENDQKLVQAVIHHDAVICELFKKTSLLPLRFGTYFRTQQELLDHLATHAQTYTKKMEELLNQAELTLKLTPIPFSEEEDLSKAEKGKAYLKAKKQRYQQQTNYKNQQEEELKTLEAQIAQNYPKLVHGQPQDNQERFYLLITNTELSAFSAQIEQWQNNLQTWILEASEPLPPYHFL